MSSAHRPQAEQDNISILYLRKVMGIMKLELLTSYTKITQINGFCLWRHDGTSNVSRVHCRSGLWSSIAAKKDPNIAHNDAEDINAKHIYFAIRPNVRNMLLPYLSYSLSNDHMSSERIFVEILLNKLEQNLQLGQLHHWATSNGAEITVSNNSFRSRNL